MSAAARRLGRVSHGAVAALLLLGLGASMALWLAIAGGPRTWSPASGLVFAGALVGLSMAAGWRPGSPTMRAAILGLGGAAFLLVAPVATSVAVGHVAPLRIDAFAAWAPVAVAVAISEEVLLRGALFDAVAGRHGDVAAVALAAVAFGVLHVPLYGWGAVPLDVAVGVWLGGLRLAGGGVLAPATAHALADLPVWWLR